MKTKHTKYGLILWTIFTPMLCFCQVEFDHHQDVIYGYKDGMALVMDVYSPLEKPNKAGIILVMAGGIIIDKLVEHGVPCKLLVMPGAGHGWETPLKSEYAEVKDWFNKFLLSENNN